MGQDLFFANRSQIDPPHCERVYFQYGNALSTVSFNDYCIDISLFNLRKENLSREFVIRNETCL